MSSKPHFFKNIYVHAVSLDTAIRRIQSALDREALIEPTLIPSHESMGRVSARPVYARFSAPTFHSAATDGIAVNAETTFDACESSPLVLHEGSDFHWISAGQPLPRGNDAVVMFEHVALDPENGGSTVRITAPATPWQHVRRIGEAIVATELLFPRNHEISAYDVGTLLSGGIWELSVWERVRLCLMPTGDHVLDFNARPSPGHGQVIESNSQVMAALARGIGCRVSRTPPVPDNKEALNDALTDALNSPAHVIVICAGYSSEGVDHIRALLEERGTLLIQGIQAMPGKPTLAAVSHNGKLIIVAPEYPFSSAICFEKLVMPVLCWLSRKPPVERQEISATLTNKITSAPGTEDFVRVNVGKVGNTFVAMPLKREDGNASALSRAQGVIRISAQTECLNENDKVKVKLLTDKRNLENVIMVVGSHDSALDILADELMAGNPPYRLESGHSTSMSGISAIKNNYCLFSGIHLLDAQSGDFNHPFLQKHLPDESIILVNFVIRHQGLIVAPGNPKGISGISDLTRPDVRFINRKKEAATRILLDSLLREANINGKDIAGYSREEDSHLAVAAGVLTGVADCGMGIRSAAKALKLGFVPVTSERFDLAIPGKFLNDPRTVAVLKAIRSPRVKERIAALPGYETRLTGKIMRPGDALMM